MRHARKRWLERQVADALRALPAVELHAGEARRLDANDFALPFG